MKIQVNLPMLEVQPWDSVCFALGSKGLYRYSIVQVNRDFNLLRNDAYHSYAYNPYKLLLKPLNEEFKIMNTRYVYKKCEYRIWLYHRELQARYKGNKLIYIPCGFVDDMETLKYMGYNGICHDN